MANNPSKVYWMNDRAFGFAEATQNKAIKVLRDAGIATLFKPGDTVGIKIHTGEYGNSMNIRPQFVNCVVDEVKRLGGKPVIVECTTTTMGDTCSRATEADILWSANKNGINEESMGCPIWICDGKYGYDDVQVPVPHGIFLKHSFMGKKLLDLDAIIVVSHFKGHPSGVFGGAIKNVGIGMGSKRGKLSTHYMNHPDIGYPAAVVHQDKVQSLVDKGLMDVFLKTCPFDCYSYENGELRFDKSKCTGCGCCYSLFRWGGVITQPYEGVYIRPFPISDSAAAFINAIGPEKMMYLNYAIDISPWRDCTPWHDRPMIPNVGVFASKDPVAVDMACLEACDSMDVVPGSQAVEMGFTKPGEEKFTNVSSPFKISQWYMINSAIYNGIGSSEYVLVESEPVEDDTDLGPLGYSQYRPAASCSREAWQANKDWDPHDPWYEKQKLSFDELAVRPKGKIEDISIKDEQRENAKIKFGEK